MSLRARLLLLILFATLIPALVAGWQFLERRDAEIAAARQDLAAAARQVAQALKDTIRATAQLHYGLSRARDLDTQDRAACSDFLANVLKEYPQYTGILTITPQGDLFCDSLRTGRALHLTDRRYFQQALASEDPLAVEPAFGRLTGIAVLQIAYAARRETGESKFVLLASLNLEKTMQSRSQSLPRPSAVIALVDGQGTVLTWHPGGEKLRGTSIAGSPLFRFARERQGEEVREDIESGGVSRIWAASALPEFPAAGLHVLVGVSKQDLLAAANRNLIQALAILGVVWLLVFGGAWMLVELGVRRQAARIIAAVARFSGGDFAARIGKPYPHGDIGDLMAALDRAFALMQAQRDVIEGLNADLERRVVERTAQIEAAIRELKDTEAQLVQSAKMASLGELVAGIAHEVNNPLSFVMNHLDTVERALHSAAADAGRTLSADAAQKLQKALVRCAEMHNGLERIKDLMLKLRTFSRLDQGERVFVDIEENIESVITLLQYRLRDRIQVKRRYGKVTMLACHPGPLNQVLMNLLSNAIDAIEGEGQIAVETKTDGPMFVISVSDTGRGMPEAVRERIFEPFFTTKPAGEGTGLGLSISYGIIRDHGGEMEARSVEGKGTQMIVRIPLDPGRGTGGEPGGRRDGNREAGER